MDFLDEELQTQHLFLIKRICRVCGEEKDLVADFYKCRKNAALESSYSYECKECTVKRILERRKNCVRFSEYSKILAEQSNSCAICGSLQGGRKYNSFKVDRNSKTGTIRGLICKSCDTIIKEVGDNIHTLENMIEYLHKTC